MGLSWMKEEDGSTTFIVSDLKYLDHVILFLFQHYGGLEELKKEFVDGVSVRAPAGDDPDIHKREGSYRYYFVARGSARK